MHEIARLARENGSLVCLDCAQAMCHASPDVQELDCLGLDGTVRVSPALYNTFEEIDVFADGVERIIKATGGVRNGWH